jgi:hypothetical protein
VVRNTPYRPRRAAVPQPLVPESASRRAGYGPGGAPVYHRGVSALLSPIGTRGGVRSQARVELTSTFLRPLAPRALPRFVATMDALTPARPALRMGAHEHRSNTEQVSWLNVPGLRVVPSPTTWCAWSSLLSFSRVHRDQLPPLPPQGRQHGIGASPFPSRLAATTRPNRVRYPTDRRFTSGCSPPHLAVTQLPSVTSPRTWT